MHTISWLALLPFQYAALSLAAPPQSFPEAATVTPASSVSASQSLSAAAATSSPYWGYFRTKIGDIATELPVQLKNEAHASQNANYTSAPPITASLPPAPTISPTDVADYPINSPHRVYNYSIPSTRTTLILHLANPAQVPQIPPVAYADTLLSLQRNLQHTLNTTGDRWLLPSEDPYGWDIGLGCWAEFWSNPDKGVDPVPGEGRKLEKQHLTLGVLSVVVGGLLERLVYKGVYEFVYLEIWDAQWGCTGFGFVSPEVQGGIGGVLDVLRIEGKR